MKRLLIATLFLAGCAANAQPLPPQVNVKALESAHPLYATLAQYDRQIAALRATLDTPQFEHASGDISASAAAVRNDAAHARDSVEAVLTRSARAYAARRNAAARSLLAQPDAAAPSGADVRAHLQQTYNAQSAQMRSGASDDMQSYAAALRAQEQAAYTAFVNSAQSQVRGAYDARAQELRENESALLLDLARKHASRRLELRAKLQTLYLLPDRRKRLESELRALQHSENAAVSSLRQRDAGTLETYRRSLLGQASRDIAAASEQLHARTQANLAARRRVLDAQNAVPADLPLSPAGAKAAGASSEDLRSGLSQLQSAGASGLQSNAQRTQQAYAHAGSDLSTRFAAIGRENDASAQAAKDQIARLEKDRADLKTRIDDDVERFARDESARCNCANVTAAVRKDLQSLSS